VERQSKPNTHSCTFAPLLRRASVVCVRRSAFRLRRQAGYLHSKLRQPQLPVPSPALLGDMGRWVQIWLVGVV